MSQVDELIKQLNTLHLQETRILGQLAEARRREENRAQEDTPRHPLEFRVGDRVALKTARFPYNGHLDRRAVVNTVTGDKIHITTLNGRETWRAPKNLTLLE
jgi:hypothetical protein